MVAQFEHYFSRKPRRQPQLGTVTLRFQGCKLDLLTSPGVFSYDAVDKGTLLLIDEMRVPDRGLVLDLGCGYGAMAVCASQRGATVVGVDVNERAAWLASMNLRRHATGPWLVVVGDLYSPFASRFDAILCNPPIRAGREIVAEIIRLARKYLRDEGSLQLVARTRMGARALSSLMQQSFGNLEEIGRRSGYRVLLSRRRGGRVD